MFTNRLRQLVATQRRKIVHRLPYVGKLLAGEATTAKGRCFELRYAWINRCFSIKTLYTAYGAKKQRVSQVLILSPGEFMNSSKYSINYKIQFICGN